MHIVVIVFGVLCVFFLLKALSSQLNAPQVRRFGCLSALFVLLALVIFAGAAWALNDGYEHYSSKTSCGFWNYVTASADQLDAEAVERAVPDSYGEHFASQQRFFAFVMLIAGCLLFMFLGATKTTPTQNFVIGGVAAFWAALSAHDLGKMWKRRP